MPSLSSPVIPSVVHREQVRVHHYIQRVGGTVLMCLSKALVPRSSIHKTEQLFEALDD